MRPFLWRAEKPCGRWLACVRPVWLTGPIRSKARSKAEHGGLVADLSGRSESSTTPHQPDTQRSKCGNGLAREYGASATHELTDPPPSRASPLPQFNRVSAQDQGAVRLPSSAFL